MDELLHDPQILRLYMPAFADFVTHGRWLFYPHLQPIIDALQGVAEGRIKRLRISLPPRHCKSTSASEIFPSWIICRNPLDRVIIAGYGKDFASQWGLKTRNIVADVGDYFGVALDHSSKAKDHWQTAAGGGVHCCGVGSSVAGYGANYLIIDDAVQDYAHAHSSIERANTWNWITADLMTRFEPDGAIVVIGTRWHEDDAIGRFAKLAVESGEAWTVIEMPAIADVDEDWGVFKRKAGEALCPARYTIEALEKIKKDLGPYKWGCLYQARPTTPEGMFWNSTLFEGLYQPPPSHLEYPVISVDPSLGRRKKDKALGDPAAVVGLGWNPSRKRFWVDAIIDHLRPDSLCQAIATIYHRFPVKPRKIGIESHGFQELLQPRFQQDLPKLGVLIPIMPLEEHIEQAKELRIKELDGWISERQIEVADTPGGRMLIQQLKNFPLDHDDGPDALRLGFDVMATLGA